MSSTSSLSDDINDRRTAVPARARNSDESGSPGGGGRAPPRRKTKKQHRERRHHRQQRLDMDIDAALSSSSGEDSANLASGAGRGGKRQSRLKPKHSSEAPKPQEDGRYQPQDAVEARFGGRSKWFPGKVRVDVYRYMEHKRSWSAVTTASSVEIGNYVDAIDLHAETTESADSVTKVLTLGVVSLWDSLHQSFPILFWRTSTTLRLSTTRALLDG